MKAARRVIALTAPLVCLALLAIGGASVPPTGPDVDYVVHGADEYAENMIAEGFAAFVATGLELPFLEVHVHENFNGCRGLGGLFNGDGSGLRVDLCSGLYFTVLHEFAHAWEYHNVDDATRGEFLDLHDLDSWRSREVKWPERGVEVAAETIANGLLERDLPERHCDDLDLLDRGFTLLTGQTSVRFGEARERCEGAPLGAEHPFLR